MGRTILPIVFCAFAAETLLFATYGRPLIDEGIFLTAADLFYHGLLPYRDFPSSQGPTLPYVYGLFTSLLGPSIAVGRAVSCAAWVGTGLAGAWLARRLAGRAAAALVLLLLMANLPALWAGTTVRTQSLSTLLVVLSALALSIRWSHVLGPALAPSLLLWSTGIRLTNALALLAVLVWVGARLRRTPGAWKVGALVGGQAPLVFAPMLAAPGAALFHVALAQWTRSERGGLRYETFSEALSSKLGFAFAPATDYFPIPLLALVVVADLAWSARRRWRPDLSLPLRDGRSAQLALLVLGALVFAPQLLFEQMHFEYFATTSVLLAVAVAIGVVRWGGGAGVRALSVYGVLGTLLVAAAIGASREWPTWLSFGAGGPARLREVGRELRALAGPDCTMVTFQTHLAVEAGCRPLPGLEYSRFSFFPNLPSDVAEARGVLTPELLERRIAELRPELLAVSPPDLKKLLGKPRRGRAEAETALGVPGSAFGAYAFHRTYRIGSGARLPLFPASIRVEVYARRDLLEGPRR